MARWLCNLLWMCALGAQAEEPVIIRGAPHETVYRDHPGQNRTWQPTEASRFDVLSHFHNLPTAQTEQTGSHALGFSAPRIRGQDGRFCEIWIDDLLLVDPTLAYPLLVGLDIKPFGELTFYEGSTPIQLPSVSPLGTLAFATRPFFSASTQLGSNYGKPFGHSLWALQKSVPYTFSDGNVKATVYGRTHETDGKYPYYSDNGTPYNPDDDYITWRDNNDARSWMLFPSASIENGRHEGTWKSLLYGGEGGIAGMGDVPSSLRHRWSGNLHAGTYRYTPARSKSPFVPHLLSVQHLLRADTKYTEGQYLGVSQENKVRSNLQQTSLQANWQTPFGIQLLSHVRYGYMKLATKMLPTEAQTLHRESGTGYQGISIPLWEVGTLEAKTQLQGHRDMHVKGEGQNNLDSTWKLAPSTQGTLSLGTHDLMGYGSYGQSRRLPSLLEAYGDGGEFAPSSELQSERIEHREIGIRWQQKNMWMSLARFEDRVHNKIVFVPAFTGSKAVNLEHTQIRGIEGNIDAHWRKLGLISGVAYLEPVSIMGAQVRQIPSIPKWTWTAELAYLWEPLTPRWHSRYQSGVYRDPDNSIEAPAMWLHDVSLDGKLGPESTTLRWGLRVENLLDTKRGVIYSSSEPKRKGYTAYSEQNGYPLPGRHATVYVEAEFL